MTARARGARRALHELVALRALGLPALVAAVTLARASVVHAEEPDLARARALWDEAGELERRGDFHAAVGRLRAAIQLRDTPHLRYALGWALENEGRLAEARASYELAEQRALGVSEDVVRLARKRRSLLDAELGEPLSASPTPTRPPAPAQAPERATAAENAKPGAALPWALVGAGAALAVGSALLVVSSLEDERARDGALRAWCTATACTGGREATLPETGQAASLRADAESSAAAGNTKQAVAAVLGGAAILGVAVGSVLLLRRHAGRGVTLGAAPVRGGAFAAGTLRF